MRSLNINMVEQTFFQNSNPQQSKWQSRSGKDGEYFLVKYDARGNLLNEGVREQLKQELKNPNYTDVLVLCHGYSTKLLDDGSLDLANKMVPSFHATKPADRKCLNVAVSWPSDVPSTLTRGHPEADLLQKALDALDELQQVWAAIGSITKLKDYLEKFISDRNAIEKFSEAEELPEDLSSSIADLSNEMRKHSAPEEGDTKTMLDSGIQEEETPETVNQRFRTFRDKPAESITSEKSGEEKDDISEPGNTIVAERSFPIVSWVTEKVGAVVHVPRARKFINDLIKTLFDVIYLTFERRATIVGGRGLHYELAYMMENSSESVRFHLFGHSMGTHIAQSAAIGRTEAKLTRKVHSLMMAQGACSTDVYAKGGPYRSIVSSLRPIAGPILATIMKDDEALNMYDMFLTKPLGKFGFFNQKPFQKRDITVVDVPEEKEEELPLKPQVFEKNTVYNLFAKSVISDHGDIQDKELSSLFWQAAVIDMEDKDYVVTPPANLPEGFWDNYQIRNEGKLKEGWLPNWFHRV